MLAGRTIGTLVFLALVGACGWLYWQVEGLRGQAEERLDERYAEPLAERARQVEALMARLGDTAAKVTAVSNDLVEVRDQLTAEKGRHGPLQTQVKRLLAAKQEASARLENLEADAGGRSQAEAKAGTMSDEIETLKAQVQSIRTASSETDKQADALRAERDAAQAALQASDKRIADLETKIGRIKTDMATATKQLAESRSEAAALRKQIGAAAPSP